MSEYIVCPHCHNPLSQAEYVRVIRCRDCVHYYEADNYHPQGNVLSHCCKYFDAYNDEVTPEGYCAWGERRDA